MFESFDTRRWRRWMLALLALTVGGLLAACAASKPTPMTDQALARATPAPQLSATNPGRPMSTDAAVMPTMARPTPTHTSTSPTRLSPMPTSPPPQPVFQPEGIELGLESVVGRLDRPVFATHAGDGSGRLFLVEKSGVVRIWDGNRLLETPFLDIQARVGSRASEQGLLGLAFAPDYGRSGAFFVDYTDRLGNTVVTRFTVSLDPDIADPSSEFKVLEIAQPAANHNGGMLAFGPDGYLYVGTGDGGGANDQFGNGQNPGTLLGKLLRLDVTTDPTQPYRIPADNPWVNKPDVRDEIWAWGLRNPWRFSFDRLTGALWIGDVGQNRYEEVDLAPIEAGKPAGRGLNFGWSIMEGTHCFPETALCNRAGLTLPTIDYGHDGGNCSITGGYVYRGQRFPVLTGTYLYGDYCSGKIWALGPDGAGGWRSALLLDSDLNISSFAEDETGELYVLDLNRGGLYRVTAQSLSRNYLPLWAATARYPPSWLGHRPATAASPQHTPKN